MHFRKALFFVCDFFQIPFRFVFRTVWDIRKTVSEMSLKKMPTSCIFPRIKKFQTFIKMYENTGWWRFFFGISENFREYHPRNLPNNGRKNQNVILKIPQKKTKNYEKS